MVRQRNLYISRLASLLLFGIVACFSLANADYERLLIPSAGARPELLTVFDMRANTNQAERILAKSAQGLMNSDPQRTDKIYLIFNDDDAKLLHWLVAEQYVLSTGTMHDLEELIRRYPDRGCIIADEHALQTSATLAGCDRLMLVTDPSLIDEYHLVVRDDVRGKWASDIEGQQWLLDHRALNRRVVAVAPAKDSNLDLLDYQVANKMFAVTLSGKTDSTIKVLADKFDPNIPCLASEDVPAWAIDAISSSAKFVIPTNGLSNLSVWTSFDPYEADSSEFFKGATAQPRSDYLSHVEMPSEELIGKDVVHQSPWLRELAPPIYEAALRQDYRPERIQKDAYDLGLINKRAYASACSGDRVRIWDDYQRLARWAVGY